MNEKVTGDTLMAGGVLDQLKKKASNLISGDEKAVREEVVDEISIDIEEIKDEISKAVRSAIDAEQAQLTAAAGTSDTAGAVKALGEAKRELEAVKVRLQAIQVSTEELVRDNGNNITALHRSVADIRDRIGEIVQSINGLSKVSDSVFDLKNSQVNMKKSIDNAEAAIKALKKKISVATAIFSVIGVLIIVLQIIALLS